MDVNKFQILRQGGVDKQINIPIELTWDYLGLDDSIDEYETKIIEEVIGVGRDFEVSRFSHAPHNSPSIYINTTTGQIFNEENTGSLASNRFVLGVANKTIGVNSTATFIYVSDLTILGTGGQSRWVLTSST